MIGAREMRGLHSVILVLFKPGEVTLVMMIDFIFIFLD
jgi:hypothetical protein